MTAIQKKLSGGLALLVLLLITAGCSKSGSEPSAGAEEGLFPEAVALKETFASADPGVRNPVVEALKLIKAGATNPTAYGEVIPQLEKLAANPNLTAAQKKSLDAVVQKIKTEFLAAPRR